MHLKIASPEKQIFAGEVEQVTLPTESGEITLLPGHIPLTSVVGAGILRCTPSQLPEDTGFVINQGQIHIGVSKGLLYVDGTNLIVLTSLATTTPSESQEVLEQMQTKLQAELEKIKHEWSDEDLEHALLSLEKVTAELRLSKLSHVTH